MQDNCELKVVLEEEQSSRPSYDPNLDQYANLSFLWIYHDIDEYDLVGPGDF